MAGRIGPSAAVPPKRPERPGPRQCPPAGTSASASTSGSAATAVGTDGKLTLLRNSRLHHIGVDCRWAGTKVLILVRDLDFRIITQ